MKNNPVILRTSSCDEIIPDKKMALRFMGCKELSDSLEEVYEKSLQEYKKAAIFKAVYRETSVTFFGEKGIRFDFGEIESADLRKNLEGCSSAFIFAATSTGGITSVIKDPHFRFVSAFRTRKPKFFVFRSHERIDQILPTMNFVLIPSKN